MAKVINFAKMIRRNWKKSTLLFGLLAYGSSYGVEKYQTFQMMRAYCEEAKVFGEKAVASTLKPKHVTVILNPEANDKKSNIQFEKFAAPLLHLAGYKVSMFQTESEKQACDLMEVMSNTDAVLIAGGDGSVHEAVTGLLRRPSNEDEYLPIGIIPLGKTNTVANYLFGKKSSSRAQLMAEAAMAVIREGTVMLDVMKVEPVNEQKPLYAVSSFEQGVFAEVEPKVQKYWYLGGLKDKFTYLFNAMKDHDLVTYSQLHYAAPCEGCSKCYVPPNYKEISNQGNRWWSVFIPKQTNNKSPETHKDFSKVINEDCGKIIPLDSTFSNFSVYTSYAGNPNNNSGVLWIKTYPKNLSFKEFFLAGLNHRKSKLQPSSDLCTIINAREVKIKTVNSTTESQVSNSESEIDTQSQTVEANVKTFITEGEISNTEGEIPHEEVENANQGTKPNEKEVSSSEKSEVYYYIDKEKYRMASCEITLLPKKVIVYS